MTSDVGIVGGGVIGLSIAWALAREGIPCSVIDRADAGRASWAGAGIIAPGATRPVHLPMARLRTLSAELFPAWSASLLEETDIDVGYRRCGGLDVALTDAEAEDLRAAAGRWRLEGIAAERLSPREVEQLEPSLTREIRVAYYLADRAQVRNPRLLRALRVACERRGVRFDRGHEVRRIDREGGGTLGLITEAGRVDCGAVVVAAGTWSAALVPGLKIAPVKGQIVLLRSSSAGPERIIERGRNYLVPRGDGLVLVGATEEDGVGDPLPDARGTRFLLDFALGVAPSLAHAHFEATWAGLRPGSFDQRPYIGFVPDCPNLLVATGHGRAGLQLSTGTAAVAVDLLTGREPSVPLDDFRPERPASVVPDHDAFRS